jgi:DNA (cytosine-5)-methyltransferase 1
MENVEGILSIGDGRIVAQVIEDFERVGYSIDHKTFNMAEYGVAQTRRRTIFVAFRSGKSVRWPELTHALRSKIPKNHPSSPDLPLAVSVNEALSDLKLPIGNFFAHRANSQMRGPRNRDANRDPAFTLRVRGDEFALCEEPATGAFIPDTRVGEPTRRYLPKNAFQVLMQEPSPWRDKGELKTLVRRQRQPVNGSRFLTLREQSRLQSFPDWFEFKGRRTSVAKQIGNAVPPVFAARLFAALIEQI